MSLARSELETIPGLGAGLDERWRRLGEAGGRWTGAERVAMVREARAARDGVPPCGDLDSLATRAVRTVAAHPASIREHWVDSIISDGLDPASYVELVAVVSRAVAIDTVCESLGVSREPPPAPLAGDPTEEIDPRARRVKAWVPMVGGTSITQALSLVPTENTELEHLSGALYLTFEEMADARPDRALTRPQMELVAARTSAINECFY